MYVLCSRSHYISQDWHKSFSYKFPPSFPPASFITFANFPKKNRCLLEKNGPCFLPKTTLATLQVTFEEFRLYWQSCHGCHVLQLFGSFFQVPCGKQDLGPLLCETESCFKSNTSTNAVVENVGKNGNIWQQEPWSGVIH